MTRAKVMTARQAALIAYIREIYPAIKGACFSNEMMERVVKCVREDAEFVLRGLAEGVLQMGCDRVPDLLEGLAHSAGKYLGDLVRKKR